MIFKSTLRTMGWDLNNIQKLRAMNLVGLMVKPAGSLENWPCPSRQMRWFLLKNDGLTQPTTWYLGWLWLHDMKYVPSLIIKWLNLSYARRLKDHEWSSIYPIMLCFSYEKENLWRQIAIDKPRPLHDRSRRGSNYIK